MSKRNTNPKNKANAIQLLYDYARPSKGHKKSIICAESLRFAGDEAALKTLILSPSPAIIYSRGVCGEESSILSCDKQGSYSKGLNATPLL